MKTYQLIYSSQPFGYNLEILSSILTTSRVNNKKREITGALICREDIFLQLLEGPKEDIEETYDSIKRDDRHLNVQNLIDHNVDDRLFPAWAMHEVVANNIKTERNSLAFNFMPKGETGVNDSSWVY